MWERLPAPEAVGGDPIKIAREIRDIIGATVHPWSSTADIAALLGRPLDGFVPWSCGYVENDAPAPAREAHVPLDRVLRAADAAAATFRGTAKRRAAVRRRGFVLAACELGYRDAALIGAALDLAPDSVRRLARERDARLAGVVVTYATDPRLISAPRFRRLAA